MVLSATKIVTITLMVGFLCACTKQNEPNQIVAQKTEPSKVEGAENPPSKKAVALAPSVKSIRDIENYVDIAAKLTPVKNFKTWKNSLGMELVELPKGEGWLCRWVTTVQEYRLFCEATDRTWDEAKEYQYKHPDRPAVKICY